MARRGWAGLGKAWQGLARQGELKMLFKPTRPDGRSYRDVAIDIFKDLEPETIVKYDAIREALDLDVGSPHIGAIVRSAIKPLLRLHQRGLVCVKRVGYRVLPARENMLVAHGHRSKADRAMGRAMAFINGANRGEMTEAERKLHDGQAIIMAALISSHRHLDSRINKIEELLRGGTTIQGD
jgi:hypothetical protein